VLQHDAMSDESKIYRIPHEADCLYAYSTVSGKKYFEMSLGYYSCGRYVE
jgi:hypothetical protein